VADGMAKEHAMIESGRRQSLGKRIWKNRWVYLFLLPGIAFVLLFCYGPMYGLVVAFKDYKISKGILGSPWANPWYNNFAMMFKDKKFTAAFFNTIRMGLAYIITGFPGPIILALLLNELRSRHYKNTLQVIYTFPNFLSWVIVGGLMTTIFAGEGVINSLIRASGGQTYYSFRSAVINNIRDIIIQAVISDDPETVWNDFVNEHREEGDKLAAELTEEFLK
jgi:putative aldouronate transport system permease protein